MGISITMRYAYDDVALIASMSPQASQYRLEVLLGGQQWQTIEPRITDSYLNWSTPDLALWDDLRNGDQATIEQAFPEAGTPVRAGQPFAVMWNISDW